MIIICLCPIFLLYYDWSEYSVIFYYKIKYTTDKLILLSVMIIYSCIYSMKETVFTQNTKSKNRFTIRHK